MSKTTATTDWAAVEFETASDMEDMASWLMVQCGSLGCEVKPAGEDKISINASFKKEELDETTMRKVVAALEEYGLSKSLGSLRVRKVPGEDWLSKWKEGFEPFRVGTKLVVCPAWHKDTLSDEFINDREVVLIEPGMAFGTGLHTTTQYCLRTLESYPPKGRILDVGTGSGILAIAARLINPTAEVFAVDTDELAIESARTNLRLNKLEDAITLSHGSLETVAGKQFDMLLSNLTLEDIVALLPEYVKLLRPRGKVLCAGILKDKYEVLERAVVRHPLTIEHTEELGDWVGVVLQH